MYVRLSSGSRLHSPSDMTLFYEYPFLPDTRFVS